MRTWVVTNSALLYTAPVMDTPGDMMYANVYVDFYAESVLSVKGSVSWPGALPGHRIATIPALKLKAACCWPPMRREQRALCLHGTACCFAAAAKVVAHCAGHVPPGA